MQQGTTIEAKLVRKLSGNTTIGEPVGTIGLGDYCLMPFVGMSALRQKRSCNLVQIVTQAGPPMSHHVQSEARSLRGQT
jgi:hypothetical protein